jgi:hypothetical protein
MPGRSAFEFTEAALWAFPFEFLDFASGGPKRSEPQRPKLFNPPTPLDRPAIGGSFDTALRLLRIDRRARWLGGVVFSDGKRGGR